MPRANPMRGEANLGAHLIRMNFGAWVAFEEESGRKISDHALDLAMGLGAGDLANWYMAFLAEEKTREEVIEIISEAGHPEALEAITKAAESYFGPMVKKGTEANPPKAE